MFKIQLFLILLIPAQMFGQYEFKINGQNFNIPSSVTKKKHIAFENECYQPIYKFKENEKVASIGAGWGINEIIYSLESPKLYFYLEDINAQFLNVSLLEKEIFLLQNSYGKQTKSEFRIYIGDSISTKLPKILFDKVLIENSLHEFSNPYEMLCDIEQKLSNNGSLFVSEYISSKPNKKHKGCGKPMFLESELINLFTKHNLILLKKYQPYLKKEDFIVFEFRKKM